MASTFNCPTCGAPLHTNGIEADIICEYCGSTVIVPAELRTAPAVQPAQAGPSVPVGDLRLDDPFQRRTLLRQGMQMIREGRSDEAAALLSSVTGAPLATTRPMVDRIAQALGTSGRINPLELMALLSQISPGEDFWGQSQARSAAFQPPVRNPARRRGGGLGCLFMIGLVVAALYLSSNTPAHLLSQATVLLNQFTRLLH